MTSNYIKPPSDESVLYTDTDYAGLMRRLVIVLVDGTVVLFVCMFLVVLWSIVLSPIDNPGQGVLFSCVAFIYVYLAILKRTRLRTLGFWVAGVKIVDHKGRPPSIIRMTFRLLLWLLGPFNPAVDLLWLGGDQHRQTLRDKFAGTYVVNHRSSPVACGKRKAAYYNFMGATLIFWEVRPVESTAAQDAPASSSES